jgi:hypothetical protein
MAKKVINSDKFRRDRAAELRQLASVLEDEGVCLDVSPINAAMGSCYTDKPNGDSSWGYDIAKQLFRIENQRHTIPDTLFDISLELSLSVKGLCHSDGDLSNTLSDLAVDFVIRGRDARKQQCVNSWHLDKHIPGEEDPQYAHPEFHFQHGGKLMRGDYGSAIIFESPRIAHPPMDGILAVDFVISNFLGVYRGRLKDNNEYQNLVRSAQARLWRPYALTAASHWVKEINTGWVAPVIWPQLVI